MNSLGPEGFPAFFAAVNRGRQPFPWQVRLVRQLFDTNGQWPELLALPTASGKTSTVDIALYALAAGLPLPRRIVFVVDRRVIVQQAADHARAIREVLQTSDEPAVERVADGLRRLHADVDEKWDCFTVAELRGAIEQDRRWAERPDVPAVIASTVDQIGSRLLFRGYGVSDRMLPIHAGLLGNDALILLDEVHLARPFTVLLHRIYGRYRPAASGIPDRWQVVELSATPDPANPRATFDLDAADHDHPVLGARLHARKPARLVSARVPADPSRAQDALAKEHAKHTVALLGDDRVRSIGVVVNRVRLAALVYRELRKQCPTGVELALITGRMRGQERGDAIKRVQERVGSQSADNGCMAKFVVVATQTIEAGADLDFDAMVTDCASIDALIQRFGRVDRMGRLSAAITEPDDHPRSVIVGTDRLTKDRFDPVYGEALSRTWEWLQSEGEEVDFGLSAGQITGAASRRELLMPRSDGPVLTRSHLDRLVRTSPLPDADVDIDSFLHGLDSRPDQDIEIVWRADLSRPTLESVARPDNQNSDPAGVTDLITALPPAPDECVPVPLSQAKEWLNRNRTDGETPYSTVLLTDLETSAAEITASGYLRPCIVWRAGECFVTTEQSRLRPGDTLIVPSEYGGLEAGNWAPASAHPVSDIAEQAAWKAGQFRLRLNPAILLFDASPLLKIEPDEDLTGLPDDQRRAALRKMLEEVSSDQSGEPVIRGKIPSPQSEEFLDEPVTEHLRTWLSEVMIADAVDPGSRTATLQRLSQRLTRANYQVVTSDFGPVYLISSGIDPGAIDTDPTRSSDVGKCYPLDDHLGDVGRWTANLARALGVGEELVTILVTAAQLHDIGKADPRFQLYLNEGKLAAPGVELLAKSAIPRQDQARNRKAQLESGYPRGLRHEIASAALSSSALAELTDPILGRCLVTTHHGYGRPFFRPQIDPDSPAIGYSGRFGEFASADPYRAGSFGSHAAQDFSDSVGRFGWWGLAWLEAVLRLADHGASRFDSQVADHVEEQ